MDQHESEILLRGLKFCPTPKTFDFIQERSDRDNFCRKLKLTEFFSDVEEQNLSLVKPQSKFNPHDGRNELLDRTISLLKSAHSPKKRSNPLYNISRREREAIESLRSNKKLVIKEADKGATVVIMDTDYYVEKAETILQDSESYEQIENNEDKDVMKKIKKLTSDFSKELTDHETSFLTKFEVKDSNFYGLPKIHRSSQISEAINKQRSEIINIVRPNDLKLRPIIAGPACPTHRLSHFIDLILQPLTTEVSSYIKDDFDILRKLPAEVNKNFQMATYDVENLYGNITHELGLEAVKFWLEKCPRETSRISNKFILNAVNIILKNNIFQFNGRFYRQLRGTAMGTKMAPIYATLSLGFLENKLYSSVLNNFSFNIYDKFRKHYFRYLDDILILYDCSTLSINNISDLLNSLCSDLHFKLETTGEEVNFLDISIKIVDGELQTDIFSKTTDTKQYLNFHSNHPRHVKRALPYNLARRICTIVSLDSTKRKRLQELKAQLVKCNYPEALIDDGIKKALSYDRACLLNAVSKRDTSDVKQSVVHVTTYDPNFTNSNNLMAETFDILQKNESTRKSFENKRLIFSKRQPPNLKRILTSAKFNNTNNAVGVFKCQKSRCQICQMLITGNCFNSSNPSFNFRIGSYMTCDTLNCIYVLKCCGCEKLYIGETNNFRLRINLHKDHAKNNTGLNVSKHIYKCTDKLKNLPKFNAMPILKIIKDDTFYRKHMELHFINKFKPQLNCLH